MPFGFSCTCRDPTGNAPQEAIGDWTKWARYRTGIYRRRPAQTLVSMPRVKNVCGSVVVGGGLHQPGREYSSNVLHDEVNVVRTDSPAA